MNLSIIRSGWVMLLAAAMLGWLVPIAASAQETEQKVTSTYKENVVVERTTTVQEVVTTTRKVKERYKCAIFVASRAERIPDKKVEQMQDFLTGYATDKGFILIAREDIINAVANLANAGPNKGDPKLAGAELDKLLSNNTSALRLAQNLDADYILVLSITSFGTDTQKFKDVERDLNLLTKKHQMKATYKLLDGTMGGSMTAGVTTATVIDRIDPRNGSIERENLVDDLIDSCAMNMAEMLDRAARRGAIDSPTLAAGEVTFDINCGVANLVFPEVIKDEKGNYVILAGRYRLEAMAVVVELDGVGIGTTGTAPLKGKPGLHKLRLRRAMFKDYEGTVKVSQGTTFDITMEMTPEGFAQFREMASFMQGLKERQMLTEGQVKTMEGYAKKLSQSGVRVDIDGAKKDPNLAVDIFDPILPGNLQAGKVPTTQPGTSKQDANPNLATGIGMPVLPGSTKVDNPPPISQPNPPKTEPGPNPTDQVFDPLLPGRVPPDAPSSNQPKTQ